MKIQKLSIDSFQKDELKRKSLLYVLGGAGGTSRGGTTTTTTESDGGGKDNPDELPNNSNSNS